jgi:hypothetical protein
MMSKATIRVFLSLRIVHWRYEVIKWLWGGHGNSQQFGAPSTGWAWCPVTLKRGLFCWLVGRRGERRFASTVDG